MRRPFRGSTDGPRPRLEASSGQPPTVSMMSDLHSTPPRPARQPSLGDRLRDLAARLDAWLDLLRPQSPPVLVPVPVRVRKKRG